MPDRTGQPAAVTIDGDGWVCPVSLRDAPNIVMGHGSGGAMSGELIEHLFLPAFGAAAANGLGDSAVVDIGGSRLAFTTDSFVVKPTVFPGGTIGDLAVNGTVNDLAVAGAHPRVLSTAFILEEGTPLAEIAHVAEAMGAAARAAGVHLVTGDTKVVDAGHGDGIFVNTTGLGSLAPGVDIRPQRVRPGDVVLISGEIGVHGIAVLSCREGLEFGTTVHSDTAPLHEVTAALLATCDVHMMRDPTRGGVAATVNEVARAANVGVRLEENTLPVPAAVSDACGLLGLDPLYVANEGKLVAFVAPGDADRALAALRSHPLGRQAVAVGECVAEHPGVVAARTGLGGTRIVDLPASEQLPRIC